MNVKLKNIEIINAFNSVSELMQEKNIPLKTKWNISKNMKEIENAFKTYIEFEQKLVQEYALKDDEGNIKIDDDNQPKFPPRTEYHAKRAELLNFEDSLEILLIKLEDLEKCDISPATLYNLYFMIED